MEYKKNDYLEVNITDIGNDGEGIGKINGYTLFVKDALPGDTVKVKIMKAKKNYSYAHLEEIINPSEDRVNPICSVSKPCGGCQLQAISYERQLKYKENKVRNNLIRIGGFEEKYIDSIMDEIIGMDISEGCQSIRYRNKAQFPVGYDKNGNLIAGFYAGHSHNIIPIEDCQIGTIENKDIINVVLGWMKSNSIKAYDEITGKGIVRHILIRKGFTTGQIMVCLVINAVKLPAKEELISLLTNMSFDVNSISYSVNTDNTNVIMGDNYHTIYGKDTIEDYIGDLRFNISPLSFFQVNPVQTKKLYETALEYADLKGGESVWDLYCGIGTISLFLAQKAGHVNGVEIIPQAIEDAKENARINKMNNTSFYVGKAEDVLPRMYMQMDDESQKHPDVIVVDPPRKGCDQVCLGTMIDMQPNRIVYVSCDSATLSRDLKYLCEHGYKLDKVRACDMFPMTTHVETVCKIIKEK